MAPGQKMQRVAHPPQKIARLDHLGRLRLGDDGLLHQLFERMNFVFDLGEPHRSVQIAQPAFAVLDLRLEQIDRIAILGVAFATFVELGGEELVLVAIEDVGDEQLVQIGVKLFVAAQKSRVEDRGFFFQVLIREPHAFLGRANAVPDDQARVPQRMQHYFGDDFGVRTALVVVQKQQIDVGLRIQLAASVTAARDHRNLLIQLGRSTPRVPHRHSETAHAADRPSPWSSRRRSRFRSRRRNGARAARRESIRDRRARRYRGSCSRRIARAALPRLAAKMRPPGPTRRDSLP